MPRYGKLAPIAYVEITRAVEEWAAVGVNVQFYEDGDKQTPDSVFPNNWLSTYVGGDTAIYPMKASSRRFVRRYAIIEDLKRNYHVQEVIDYSSLEPDELFLDRTGAMVLDHNDRVT